MRALAAEGRWLFRRALAPDLGACALKGVVHHSRAPQAFCALCIPAAGAVLPADSVCAQCFVSFELLIDFPCTDTLNLHHPQL